MPNFIPKDIEEEDWEKLTPHKSYAVLCVDDQKIHLRIGAGKSFYLEVVSFKGGSRLVNSLQYDTGDDSLLFKLPPKTPVILGRSLDSNFKIMHSIVSRKHAEFRLEDNILIIKDCGSTNGTFIYQKNIYFSIDDYLAQHPLDSAGKETLDEIHQLFGATLDDFLKSYVINKEFEVKEAEISKKLDEKENNNYEPDNNPS